MKAPCSISSQALELIERTWPGPKRKKGRADHLGNSPPGLNGSSLVRLGYGRFQKSIKATLTSETRQIAIDLASDKEETNRILRDAGLPVPRQRKVYRARDAVRSAEDIGYRRDQAPGLL